GDVEGRGAEAGVDVDDQRHVTYVGDAAHVDQHVVERVDAQVGHAQRTGGNTPARKVNGAITGTLGQQRVIRVDGADDLQRLFFLECLAEAGAGGCIDVLAHVGS